MSGPRPPGEGPPSGKGPPSGEGPPSGGRSARPLVEVAGLFARIGAMSFGGPAAHIAMMRDEVVRRRRWVEEPQFLALLGATNVIPGPNSTELAMHLGQRRAGARGLVVGGACFIAPAVTIVAVLAWLYEQYGTSPAVVDLRYGVLPVVIAIVGHAVVGLARSAVTSVVDGIVALGALAAYLAGAPELVVLVAAGVVTALWAGRHRLGGAMRAWSCLPSALCLGAVPVLAPPGPPGTPTAVSRWRLFLVFLQIGSVLYGSGYVLLAYLQRNLVEERGWLTAQQLLDSVAVGQVTPGPLFSTATFVGWQVDGPVGAALATTGIFLPSFAFVAVLGPLVAWMDRRPIARAFLAGLGTSSLGLMAGVALELADTALHDAVTVAVAADALVVLVRSTLNSAWLVAGGLAVGAVHALVT